MRDNRQSLGISPHIDYYARLGPTFVRRRGARLEFEDGESQVLTFPEFVIFIQNLVFLALQSQEVSAQFQLADVLHPLKISVTTQMSVDSTMRAEVVKALLSRISFESTAFEPESETTR